MTMLRPVPRHDGGDGFAICTSRPPFRVSRPNWAAGPPSHLSQRHHRAGPQLLSSPLGAMGLLTALIHRARSTVLQSCARLRPPAFALGDLPR
jgi:hypothetical protein